MVAADPTSTTTTATRLETLEGAVELTGKKGSTRVEHGFGSRVDDNGPPSAPKALPKTPVPTSPLKGEGGPLVWAAVDGAAGYVVEIARDAEHLIDATSTQTTATTTTPALAAGDWYWRVSARSAEGFVGAPSQTFKLHVGG